MLYGCDRVALLRAHVIDEITWTSKKELVVHTRKHQASAIYPQLWFGLLPERVTPAQVEGSLSRAQPVVRRQEELRVAVAESRRGYAIGAAWDEGNMIQAMARLKNPAIAWRYGDG